MAELKVTLVKSTIGAVPKHKKTVEALGLKKLNKTVGIGILEHQQVLSGLGSGADVNTGIIAAEEHRIVVLGRQGLPMVHGTDRF